MKKTYLLPIILLLFCSSLQAQTLLFFKPLNPSQFYLDDIWNISVMNNDKPVTVYLKGFIREKNGSGIASLTSVNVDLAKGSNDLSPFKVTSKQVDINNGYVYSSTVRDSRNLPFGDYELCIKVYDAQTDEELGDQCTDYLYQPVTPPVLIYPEYCEALQTKNPVFTWLPPVPLPKNYAVVYDLKICELFRGQSYEDAINRNNPVYAQFGLTQNNHLYPTIAEPFDSNKTYVWQVSARIPQFTDKETPELKKSFSSIGVSEVWCFFMKKKTEEEISPASTYIQLHKGNSVGMTSVTNILHIAYDEKYSSGNLQISFLDESGKSIDIEKEIPVKRGDNRIDIDLKETAKFKNKKTYKAKIKNNKKEVFMINFKYYEQY